MTWSVHLFPVVIGFVYVCVSTGRTGRTRTERQQRRQRGRSESGFGVVHQHGLCSAIPAALILSLCASFSFTLLLQGPPGSTGIQGPIGQPGLPVSLYCPVYSASLFSVL